MIGSSTYSYLIEPIFWGLYKNEGDKWYVRAPEERQKANSVWENIGMAGVYTTTRNHKMRIEGHKYACNRELFRSDRISCRAKMY